MMELESFLPYRLAVLAEAVSGSMSQIYGSRFELGRDEWRVLATLFNDVAMRTPTVIERTTLDKVSVSRALRRLECKRLVGRITDPDDARGYVIRLLPAGRRLFHKIAPLVLARERFLLEGLSESERVILDSVIDKLLARARHLCEPG